MPEQLAWSKELYELDMHDEPEVLASWVKHYINDPEHGVVEEWTLPTKICTKQGDNKPIFIATNFDLI